MTNVNSPYLGPIRAKLDEREFKIGEKVWYHDPHSGIMERATVGGITFDHVVTNYAIVLERSLTKANYPELTDYYEGWFAFSAPSGWLKPRYE